MHTCFAYVYTTYLTGVQGRHKGESNPLELELQTVVNCHADAGNRTQVFRKNSGALPLTHLSSPLPLFSDSFSTILFPAKSSVTGTQHYILLLINSKHLFNHLCYTSCDSHKHQVCLYLYHILMVFMVRSFVAIATASFCLFNTGYFLLLTTNHRQKKT